MSELGTILSDTDMNTEEAAPILNGADEVTGQSTVAAALEDIPGLTFNITTVTQGRIMGMMAFSCSSVGGGGAIVGGWAINFDGVDSIETERSMSGGGSDSGAGAVAGRSASLAAGTYTIKGRHRRVSGGSTVNTDVAQLLAWFVAD